MKTYTAQQLAKMDDKRLADVFTRAGKAVYGTERFGTQFSRESGLSLRTLANWRGGDVSKSGTIPAILLLQAWADKETTHSLVARALVDSAEQMAAIARTFEAAALQVTQHLDDDATARSRAAADREAG